MKPGEMALKRLQLLSAHQTDQVISAERPAHRNCGRRPYRHRFGSSSNLGQTASHRTDDDFELCSRHTVA
jgi:hypothetical protein